MTNNVRTKIKSYDTIINAFDDVVEAGLDEGVMGLGSYACELDADFLEDALKDEQKFTELFETLKPHMHYWLTKCLKNFKEGM